MSIWFGLLDPATTRELRRSVLRPNLDAGQPLPGDDLTNAVHLGAVTDDGSVLSTCFVYPDPCPWQPDRVSAWHLRQLATLPTHRGTGLGGGVLERAVELVRERGAGRLWCYAREAAATFYTRHGFQSYGGVFTDEQYRTPHRRMSRELSDATTSSSQ